MASLRRRNGLTQRAKRLKKLKQLVKEQEMGMALQCKFFGHIISVDKALAIRDGATAEQKYSLLFECDKCGKPVRPRAAGDKHIAHFIHLKENPECGYTEPPREY